MAETITGLDPILLPVRRNYRLAIESTTDPLENSKGFELDQVAGTKLKIIDSEADFPDPVSGVITFENNTEYRITNSFSMANRIDMGTGTAISGGSSRVTVITYTGSGNFLTVTDTSVIIRSMGFICTSGTFMDAKSSGLANQFVSFVESRVTGSQKFGTFEDIGLIFTNFASADHKDGISMVGTIPFIIALGLSMVDNDAGSTAIDLGSATFNRIDMTRCTLAGSGTGLSGLTNSGNVNSGQLAELAGVGFQLIATPLSGITNTDVRYVFRDCSGILNTTRSAEADLTTPETVTISSTNTFVQIGGVNWSTNTESSFSVATDGQITYTGEIERKFYVGVTATLEKVGGGADNICLRVGKDDGGGYVTTARTESCTQNASPTSVYSHGLFNLKEGDKVAPFVANEDSTANIEVTVSSFVIFET